MQVLVPNKRNKRGWIIFCAVIGFLVAVVVICVSLGVTLTRKGDPATTDSTITDPTTTDPTATAVTTKVATTTTVVTTKVATITTGVTTTVATITTAVTTTTTNGCGSSWQISTLLISDTNTATVQTLINSLQSANLTVTYVPNGIYNYNGFPPASCYGSVILITGNDYSNNMPASGQQSIFNAQQNNGTGVIITEFGAYMISVGDWTILSPLLLASFITTSTLTMSYTLVKSGHPIWNGLATSFSTNVTLGYSTLNTPSIGSIVVATCPMCGNTPGVIVRPQSGTAGRIVQINHAGHYNYGQFNWGNDANILTMMINAVKWGAQLI